MDSQPVFPGPYGLDGPRKIGARGQIAFPDWLLEMVDLVPGKDGSRVFVATNPALAGTLIVIPEAMATQELPALLDAIRERQLGES